MLGWVAMSLTHQAIVAGACLWLLVLRPNLGIRHGMMMPTCRV